MKTLGELKAIETKYIEKHRTPPIGGFGKSVFRIEVELLEALSYAIEQIVALKRAATNYLNCADTQMLAAGVHDNIAPSLKKDYDRWYSELDALLADRRDNRSKGEVM